VTLQKYEIVPWGKRNQLNMVATEAIAQGEAILCELPVVSVGLEPYRYGTYAWDMVGKLLKDARARKELRSWALSSSGWLGYDEDDERIVQDLAALNKTSHRVIKELYSVVATNNLSIGDKNGKISGFGLFRDLSRCNHACIPNASLVVYKPDESGVALGALRDIKPGESITWTYISNDSFAKGDFHARNFELMNRYGFTCECELCIEQIPVELQGADLHSYFMTLINKEAKRMLNESRGRH
jgi:hypothetical protein